MNYVRHCPRCRSARPLVEMVCLGTFQGGPCHWSLFDILPTPETPAPDIVAEVPSPGSPALESPALSCRNGHPLSPGDFLCLECGEPAAAVESAAVPSDVAAARSVQGWLLGGALAGPSPEAEHFLARRDGTTAVFKLYQRGIEPEVSLYPSLRAMDADHALRLLDTGRDEDRAFEVWEYLPLGNLAGIPAVEKADPEFARQVLAEVAGALDGLARVGIIHRDLKPANLLVRHRQPLDLVLSDFSTAILGEFDLQVGLARQAARYAAPESIIGTSSPSTDWWSLGVILLEMLTRGRDFEGVHERAFLLHLVTRGLSVPEDLPADWQELLKGLLTRDPSSRWTGTQVARWLQGERGIPHGYTGQNDEASPSRVRLGLGETEWPTPESFAIAAVDAVHWEQARGILFSGRLATWLQERGGESDRKHAAQVRDIASDTALPEDTRLAVALMVLNPNLPLCSRGEIITPNWVLARPDTAWEWLDSSLPRYLRQLEREVWLVRLHERAERIRRRRHEAKIDCDDAQLAAAMLATSRGMLEKRWAVRRKHFPEAEHPALAAMLQRRQPGDEELILLVSASVGLFRSSSEVLEEAAKEARRADVAFDPSSMGVWFEQSRAEILDALDRRLEQFVRCEREIPDQWADDFRQERRVTLARALVLLAIPADEWTEPPLQEYTRNILQFFHRRLVTGLQRGGLVRMTIGRNTARLDLTELAGPARSAEALLAAIVRREPQPTSIDSAPLLAEPLKEQRLRRLALNANSYRRDTGIDPLYLGFPFVLLRDARASDAAKPRIAPVLLWPVKLEMPGGQRGTVKLSFDSERELRPNPALNGLLGAAFSAWNEALDDLRARDHVDHQSILDALARLAVPPRETGLLSALPPSTATILAGKAELHASAVLFQCDFSGQTIAEDLQQLANGIPIRGTALETSIRAADPVLPAIGQTLPPESDRYFTAASDPSQQAAVFRARHAPGLVVQGPPGTGKSQTIVNIVSDSIGRGERVLIVCQKQAALEVVRKRLDMEGLGDRLFYLKDASSDRRPVLQELRRQLENPAHNPRDDARLRREREGIARHIETIEQELDTAHRAIHDVPPGQPGNRSYRELLDELLEIESRPTSPLPLPGAGELFRDMDHATTTQRIAQIALLTPLWLDACFEESPLHELKDFGADEDAMAALARAFEKLVFAERHRGGLLSTRTGFFHLASPGPLVDWLSENEAALRQITPLVAKNLGRLSARRTSPSDPLTPALEEMPTWLAGLAQDLARIEHWTLDPAIYRKLAQRGDAPLQRILHHALELAEEPTSFLARLNPVRLLHKNTLHRWIRQAGLDPDDVDLRTLHQAAELEAQMRGHRPTMRHWSGVFEMESTDVELSLPVMARQTRAMAETVDPMVVALQRIRKCPVEQAAESLRAGGEPATASAILDVCHASLALWSANEASRSALVALRPWFSERWLDARLAEIDSHLPVPVDLEAITAAFPRLPAFQTFRLRVRALDPGVLPVFAKLREKENEWKSMTADKLIDCITLTLRREALWEWKHQIEAACPALLMERAEFERKTALLAEMDDEFRAINRRLLALCPAEAPVVRGGAWDDVVMFTGPRARRLREVVERGDPLGLFHLRPVWMVNPEMVSRLFPLRAGLFDIVIFDEASQLPVENALPAMFRAKRVVVSGDEKQMPPTRFFGSILESDEEDEEGNAWLEGEDAGLAAEEQERIARAAGRREVKDCPDLLSLTQNLLPTAMLEIHYRSKYRQLIDFSNAAFYSNRLHVPARHPESEILRVRPMEVDRVDGEYQSQTNEREAVRVVERLREIWSKPFDRRPSTGVVTFNLKQAELIAEMIETAAEADPVFREAWIEECSRTRQGEDMGFFVKNLENVQGDERDWILFSTTFGRDAAGVFRRNFGVLGQSGGERRLNVAITRAREKIVLVTSMPVADISTWTAQGGRRAPTIPRDFLQGWLTFAECLAAGDFVQSQNLLRATAGHNPAAIARASAARSPSRFLDEVEAFLRELGHEPVPATGDAFGLDFAIKAPSTGQFGLGIECDSHCHEVLASARARELWRPAVLKQSVRALHRVTSRDWYHHREAEKNRLRAACQIHLPS